MNNKQDLTNNSFSQYIDLASEKVGGRAISCSDEWFASCSNLVKKGRGEFKEGYFVETGQWMDGWESRRSYKRHWRQGIEDCDWCVIRLGIPGVIRGFDIDTNHFRGNAPEKISIEASVIENDEFNHTDWTEILSLSEVEPHQPNPFKCENRNVWTHVRLKIYPDGGVARLRVFGEAKINQKNFVSGELVDLACVTNGGRGIKASDMFFSSPSNLIMPNKGLNMGDGWETKRRRDDKNDWAIIKLGIAGTVRKIILDTAHFKGNYPDQFSLEACHCPDDQLEDTAWQSVIKKTSLQSDREHLFIEQICCDELTEFTHVKIHIYPDGGISRLRIFGFPNWKAL